MNFKYQLPDYWIAKVATMAEFANGATQVTVFLSSGIGVPEVLISNSQYIVATRGYDELPFDISDITDIQQNELDKHPLKRDGWKYWDTWE
jgi:hypothetical protein